MSSKTTTVFIIAVTLIVVVILAGVVAMQMGKSPSVAGRAPVVNRGDDNWRARFNEVYNLKDDQIVKFIPPPFIAERATYYATALPAQAATQRKPPDKFYFTWTTHLADNPGFSYGGRSTLGGVLFSKRMGFEPWQIQAPDELLSLPLDGDWIIRADATDAQRLQAIFGIIADATGLRIKTQAVSAEHEVLIVEGDLHVVANTVIPLVEPQIPGHENNGTLEIDFAGLLRLVGRSCGMQVINQTSVRPSLPLKLEVQGWARIQGMPASVDRKALIERRIASLQQLTGLTVRREIRTIDTWQLSETEQGL